MRDFGQVFRNRPDVSFGGHPPHRVEAAKMDGAGIGAQRLFAFEIEVMLEVGDGQFAQGSVHGFAKTKAGVIGFCDCAPMTVQAEDGKDVVVIAYGFEIHEQRWESLNPESRSSQQSALQTMCYAVAQNSPRGTAGSAAGLFVIADFVIEETLDSARSPETPQDREFLAVEGNGATGRTRCPRLSNVHPRNSARLAARRAFNRALAFCCFS